MPRKVFTAGEILTAANLNDVSDQSVMVFDDASARTTAIPTPVEGMVTYLKDTDRLEQFDGTNFVSAVKELGDIGDVVITSPVAGQSLVYDGDNFVNQFLQFDVEYLVIAGGAGGGFNRGAGGGAGGYRSSVTGESSGGGASAETPLSLVAGTHTVTVGAGGAGSLSQTIKGGNGAASVLATVSTVGGGGGGSDQTNAGATGGSGGGGCRLGDGAGGSGTAGEGFAGAAGILTGARSGGGGGAGEAGNTDGVSFGGDGVASSITGSSVFRAGGGGGSDNSSTVPEGGDGGGGRGGFVGFPTAEPGVSNTGGGGGGSVDDAGANGGSGVVILKIAESATLTFSAGVTQTNATASGFTVYTVTAAGPTDTVTIA